jgi:hypothetical protein
MIEVARVTFRPGVVGQDADPPVWCGCKPVSIDARDGLHRAVL